MVVEKLKLSSIAIWLRFILAIYTTNTMGGRSGSAWLIAFIVFTFCRGKDSANIK